MYIIRTVRSLFCFFFIYFFFFIILSDDPGRYRKTSASGGYWYYIALWHDPVYDSMISSLTMRRRAEAQYNKIATRPTFYVHNYFGAVVFDVAAFLIFISQIKISIQLSQKYNS